MTTSQPQTIRPAASPATLFGPTASIRESVAFPLAVDRADRGLGVLEERVSHLWRDNEVRGRVLVVRQGPNEPMDFDPWRWIAIPAWGLMILIAPVVAAIVAWQSVGFLGALGVALVTFFVLRFMFSNRLLQSWYFVSALNGRNVVEMMPVMMIRLRQTGDAEIQLRLKGQLHGGTVIEGDRISAVGKWSRGVFCVRETSCERTGATIVPRQPTARVWAIAGMCFLICAGLWLHFAGMPWVQQQAQTFERSTRPLQQSVLYRER